MALEYVGGKTVTGATTVNGSLTGLTGGLASQPAPGDFIIVAIGVVSNDVRKPSFTSGGFTEILSYAFDTTARDPGLCIGIKFFNEGDPLTFTASASQNSTYGAVAAIQVWRGVDKNNPLDVPIVYAGGGVRTINSPAISPVTEGAQILSIGVGTSTAGFNSTTAPSGFTNRTFVSHDPGTAAGTGIASRAWDGVTAPFDPPQWGSMGGTTGDGSVAATLALRPAPEAPAGIQLAYYAGGAWQTPAPLLRFDGAEWQPANLLRWDGVEWV